MSKTKTCESQSPCFLWRIDKQEGITKERMWFVLLELSFEVEGFGVSCSFLLYIWEMFVGSVNHFVDLFRKAFPFPVLPGCQC